MYTLLKKDGLARRGVLKTAHGSINTPAFMPVGTAATVKSLTTDMVKSTGSEVLLGNTYHLMQTADLVAAHGGLHKFMNWDKPILTDSGGFQVMSLAKLRKIKEDGVYFQSHKDGSKLYLSPEVSMEIQHKLGSDITMIFDECTPFPATHKVADKSMQLSLRWAGRSKTAFTKRDGYLLFGIVQGSVYEDLRKISADSLVSIGFDGYAIGGLAVGEGQGQMLKTLAYTAPLLPENKPRYLMGVGYPDDVIKAVSLGVDMFDCVIPTRSGRNGMALTSKGRVNLRNSKHRDSLEKLDSSCSCDTCTKYTLSYLSHLIRSKEMLGATLLTLHNIHFYQTMMRDLRDAIDSGNFASVADRYLTSMN
jgi:queuine tRNA-ribosyltransferase